jgi:alkanesulfonate monooxygenase SsuD/methylene tetrahydromethanopterin reductase-like flavin-dependent oxidoreductase (luciferase family)
VKLGAHFLPEDLPAFLESVRTADEVGYDRAWLVDGHMLWQDLYVYMTHGLAATERIAFGPGVTNPLTRHFTVTASAVATLADLHPGRVLLGIGRGDNAVRTLGLQPVPTRRLVDVVPKVRQLVAGRPIDFDGTDVRIRWADEEVPIMMAATGPKNLRAAGALADIVMVYVGVSPVSVRWAIEHVRAGAAEAGQDPDAVEIAVLCAMSVSDDQEEAWDACRWAPAACANHIEDVTRRNPEHGMPDDMTRLVEARDDYDYYAGHLDSKAEHTAYLTGELIDDFAIAGPAERCLEKIRALADLGVGEISTAYLNGELEQMRRVGSEILPALGRLTAEPADHREEAR